MHKIFVSPRTKKLSIAIVAAAFIISIIPAMAFAATASTSTSSLNVVQILINPTNSNVSTFSVFIYNSSGSLVAQSRGNYPLFAFGLPSGTYLITASAGGIYYPSPLVYSPTAGAPLPLPLNNSVSSMPAIVYPRQMYEEYGYTVASISSSTSLTINTSQPSKIPTYTIDVSVTFPDGTPAASADVYASPIVEGGYYWYYSSNQSVLKMWGQTDSSGQVKLTVPEVPLLVTSWLWVPIKLPSNTSYITVNIGGEAINVSVYYQPQSVGFSGTALIIPPQSTAKITLHYQQQDYWIYSPAIQASTSITNGIMSNNNSQQALPSQVYQSMQGSSLPPTIPSFQTLTSNQPSQGTGLVLGYELFLVAASAIALTGVAILTLRRRAK